MDQDQRAYMEVLAQSNELLRNALLRTEQSMQNVERLNQLLASNSIARTPCNIIYEQYAHIYNTTFDFKFTDLNACKWRLVLAGGGDENEAFDGLALANSLTSYISRRRYGQMISVPERQLNNYIKVESSPGASGWNGPPSNIYKQSLLPFAVNQWYVGQYQNYTVFEEQCYFTELQIHLDLSAFSLVEIDAYFQVYAE